MIKKNEYFTLYSNVRITKGFNRSLLVDFYTGKTVLVPNALTDILSYSKKLKYSELLTKFNEEEKTIINQYFSFLIENNFIHYGDKEIVKCFINPSLDFSFPSEFIDSIIEISNLENYDLKKALLKLESFNVKHIELRIISESLNINDLLNQIVEIENELNFETYTIFLPFSESNKNIQFNIVNKVVSFIIYNSPNEITENIHPKVRFIKQKSVHKDQCGKININTFTYNLEFFAQSTKCNNCLSHKVSINEVGEIKNCPSSKESFGYFENFKNSNELLSNSNFTKFWNTTKDQVKVCKDCEFRYVCTDCRVFTEDKNDFSKPKNCSYDPYTNTWN
jgi:SPASM domain peptide maturase of grasp-with-spasm system